MTAHHASTDRDQDIITLRAAGHTLEAIGTRYGISRERVRQILARDGGPTRTDAWNARYSQARTARTRTAISIDTWITLHPGSTLDDAAHHLGLDPSVVHQLATPTARRLAVRPGHATARYSPSSATAALQAAWTLARADGATGLSRQRYESYRASGAVTGPTGVRLTQIHGTWTAATAAAGVPCGPRVRTYRRSTSDTDNLTALRQYLADPNARGSYHGWDTWRTEHAPHAPSGTSLRNRYGSWARIKAAALTGALTTAA